MRRIEELELVLLQFGRQDIDQERGERMTAEEIEEGDAGEAVRAMAEIARKARG